MLTKNMWNLYIDQYILEFDIPTLITGNLLVFLTPITLMFDLCFIVPEIIIYKSGNRKR